MKPAFQKWGLAREGDRKSRGEWVAKPGSFQPLLLPLPRVEGRALTLGTREQREFRGLVMATWSICKTYACVHFTTGKKVRRKREILHSGRSRRKASWSRRFWSLGGRGLLSCLCSKRWLIYLGEDSSAPFLHSSRKFKEKWQKPIVVRNAYRGRRYPHPNPQTRRDWVKDLETGDDLVLSQ